MLFKTKFLILVLALCTQIASKSQSQRIDSIKSIIEVSEKDTNQVNSLLELAALYQKIDLDSAAVVTQNALKIARVLAFHKGTAKAYRQTGIIFYMKGDYDKAIDNFSLSLKAWKKQGDPKGIARAYMNIGIIQKNLGQYDKALENYIKSSQTQKAINDIDGLARSYNNIVNIYLELGDFGTALDYSFKSLEIHEGLNNETEIAITLNNIGTIYHVQNLENKALEYNRKSLEINLKLENKKGTADNYNNFAEIYSDLADNDTLSLDSVSFYLKEVLSFLEKSSSLYQEIGYKKGIALSFNNMGLINLRLGNYGKVLPNYQKSLRSYEEMGDKNGIISTLTYKAVYFDSIQNYKLALDYFEQAKSMADEIGAPERIMEIAEGLSYTYGKLGKYKKAYENHVLFKKMTDEIISDASRKKSAQKEFRYMLSKKQKEMELKQQRKDLLAAKKLERQSLITKSVFLGLVLMIILAFFIFKNYRIKQKSNLQLAEKNKQILERNEELKQKNEEIKAISEEMERQRDIAINARKEVMDSIQYAKRIQTAVLPAKEMFVGTIADYFIFFRPRDIVSGDFYWMKQIDEYIIIVAADCTGHGVPGAFMSLLGVAFLNKIVNENMLDSAKILDSLRDHIIEALHQTWDDTEAKDGMDLSLVVVNTKTKELQYSGAYNPLYHFRNGELNEIKADKMPIGLHVKENKPFNARKLKLLKDDVVYLFSDGYADQFGGKQGRKFKYRRFKDLLKTASKLPMSEQKKLIAETHESWKNKEKQLDDILVIGLRF